MISISIYFCSLLVALTLASDDTIPEEYMRAMENGTVTTVEADMKDIFNEFPSEVLETFGAAESVREVFKMENAFLQEYNLQKALHSINARVHHYPIARPSKIFDLLVLLGMSKLCDDRHHYTYHAEYSTGVEGFFDYAVSQLSHLQKTRGLPFMSNEMDHYRFYFADPRHNHQFETRIAYLQKCRQVIRECTTSSWLLRKDSSLLVANVY